LVKVVAIDGFWRLQTIASLNTNPRQKNNEQRIIIRKKNNLLKLMSRGIPKASAQWTCANAGGLEIIASAANVRPVRRHGERQESQQPLIIFQGIISVGVLLLDVVWDEL
jgi:hypothetical protein